MLLSSNENVGKRGSLPSAIQGTRPGRCTRAPARKRFQVTQMARESRTGCCNGLPPGYWAKTVRSQETPVLRALAVRTLVRLNQSQKCSNWRCCAGEQEPGPSCRSICRAGQAPQPPEPAMATGRTSQSSRAYGQANGALNLLFLGGYPQVSGKKFPCSFP